MTRIDGWPVATGVAALAVRTTAAMLIAALASAASAEAQRSLPPETEPLGIALENFDYPHPVEFLTLEWDGRDQRMAYMDVQPTAAGNGRTVVLMHGKNFFGEYWWRTIDALTAAGYRVVVPDQIGFGKSAKPAVDYSFHRLAANTKTLLDTLGVERAAVVGHSMGGMLATRFALMYPDATTHLVLENPIGLEDLRSRPWRPIEDRYASALRTTEEGIRSYHRSYYVDWRAEYEKYVQVHYRWTLSGEYPRLARASALTGRMIYQEPVVHEFPLVRPPTLLVIGQQDRTMSGERYPGLARGVARAIPHAALVELDDVGHAPHLEAPDRFHSELLRWLRPDSPSS